MKVLITSPSLKETENVSGISTMVNGIISSRICDFVHFGAGRKDGEKSGMRWLATQIKLPFDFRRTLRWATPDLIHINTAFEPRAIVRDVVLAKSAGKVPILLHVHGGRFVMDEFPNPVVALLAERLLRASRRVIVLSEPEAESLQRRIPRFKISVLPNAVAVSEFPEVERPWGIKNVVYLGRLHEDKGLSEMVETCRQLVAQGFKFRFTCYGTGRDQERFIRGMTEVLGDQFRYGGVVSGEEKVQALNSADIFLMPSRFEGLSLSLLEAMAAGCVPIVTNRGSIPSVIEDGRNGFLIDPGDITQIVGRVKFLLSEGETGWAEYRRNARETVHDRFDVKNYAGRLKEIYTETLASR